MDIAFRFGPLGLTGFLVIWTILVSPHSGYGDSWAIYPAVLVMPAALIWHALLIWLARPRLAMLTYGLIHLSILLMIWLYCLMHISKDSL